MFLISPYSYGTDKNRPDLVCVNIIKSISGYVRSVFVQQHSLPVGREQIIQKVIITRRHLKRKRKRKTTSYGNHLPGETHLILLLQTYFPNCELRMFLNDMTVHELLNSL